MMLFVALGTIALAAPVQARSVFAHFMVGNTAAFAPLDWTSNIALAQSASIDAFALNVAKNDPGLAQLDAAFSAADASGFELFLSFDYSASGPWNASAVAGLIAKYGGRTAYFKYGPLGKPLVSTSGGAENAQDWVEIKAKTNCFLMPDWSSLDPQTAVGLAGGVADGLFSWGAAWPTAPNNISTYVDAAYFNALGNKPYMMPISPWFYTNMPGYGKNWVWKGDTLWFDRWQQLIALDKQPEFAQIISWNDFGESHYIGPIDTRQFGAYVEGNAPYNYVVDYPHDGWRELLPFFISTWKNGKATVRAEKLIVWYRLRPASACQDGSTTGNTANQLQTEYAPSQVLQDKVFFAALLAKDAKIVVTIGNTKVDAKFDVTPYGGVGVYFGSAEMNGKTGAVKVEVDRIPAVSGRTITETCSNSFNNYNAWVGNSTGPSITPVTPKDSTASLNCTSGFGVYNFAGLCSKSCEYGYCPSSACTCKQLGKPSPPAATYAPGYPLAGESASYIGLCDFVCRHGYCPSTACGSTQQPIQDPGRNEFVPDAPTEGTGKSPFEGLCSYACNYGFCPMHVCTTLRTGPPNTPPSADSSVQWSVADGYDDAGLCKFACQRKDYCPYPCSKGGVGGKPSSTKVVKPSRTPWLDISTTDAWMNFARATDAP